jgi:hypothetical protein
MKFAILQFQNKKFTQQKASKIGSRDFSGQLSTEFFEFLKLSMITDNFYGQLIAKNFENNSNKYFFFTMKFFFKK